MPIADGHVAQRCLVELRGVGRLSAEQHPVRDLAEPAFTSGSSARSFGAHRRDPPACALTLLDGADRCLAPGQREVEEVRALGEVRDEGRAHDRDGVALAVDPQALLAALLQPLAVRLAGAADDHGPAAQARDVFDVRTHHLGHVLGVAGRGALEVDVGVLDESVVAVGQYVGEGEHGLVVHHVGRHRRAVVVALDAAAAHPLHGRHPLAPASIASSSTRHISACSASVGSTPAFARSRPIAHTISGFSGTYGEDVHRLGRAVDAVEELGEGLPVPRHALLHRRQRHRFVAGHRQHRPLALRRRARARSRTRSCRSPPT